MKMNQRILLMIFSVVIPCISWGQQTAGMPPAMPPATPPTALMLSLAQAVALGERSGYPLQAAMAREREAAAHVEAVRAYAPPLLSLAHGVGSDTGGLDEDMLLTQTLELPRKRAAKIAAARAEAVATQADSHGARGDMAFAVTTAYYSALLADVECRVADEALQSAQTFACGAASQFRAGDVPQTQVVRSQLEVTAAQQQAEDARVERAIAYDALSSLLGSATDSTLCLTDKLDVTPVTYQLTDLLAYGLRQRSDVQAANLRVTAAQAAAASAKAATQPDLFWEVRHTPLIALDGDNSVRIGIVFPCLNLQQPHAETRAALAAAGEQQANAQEVRREAILEITTAYRTLQEKQADLATIRQGRLEQAKQIATMAQLGYARGASSYLEWLDAQHAYQAAQLDFARAQAGDRLALAALQHALGGSLL